jgi:hypothetical protein
MRRESEQEDAYPHHNLPCRRSSEVSKKVSTTVSKV